MSSSDALIVLSSARAVAPVDVRAIHAGFCNSRDSQGRIVFDPAYCGLDDASRAEWRALKHAQEHTHFVLAPKFAYPGFPTFDFQRTPEVFRLFVAEILRDDLVPIVYWSTGDGGSFVAETPTWPTLLTTCRDLASRIVSVPAWEAVGPGGGWSSRQFADGIALIDRYLGPAAVILSHFQPERATAASYYGHRMESGPPVDVLGRPCVWKAADGNDPNEGAWLEIDDPWQGDEAGMWHSPTGQRINIFGYETPHGSKLLNGDGWEDRWIEIVIRVGLGERGWALKPLCLLESVAYDYTHNGATEMDAVRIRERARALCQQYGIDCTWGNG